MVWIVESQGNQVTELDVVDSPSFTWEYESPVPDCVCCKCPQDTGADRDDKNFCQCARESGEETMRMELEDTEYEWRVDPPGVDPVQSAAEAILRECEEQQDAGYDFGAALQHIRDSEEEHERLFWTCRKHFGVFTYVSGPASWLELDPPKKPAAPLPEGRPPFDQESAPLPEGRPPFDQESGECISSSKE